MMKKKFSPLVSTCFAISFFILSSFQVKAQLKITGSVKDNANAALEGATITEKGTSNAASTDKLGTFKLTVKNEKSVLVISSTGFNGREVTIGKQRVITIALNASAADLDDVVIIGYGTVKKRDLTGSVGRADVVAMQKASVASLDQALAGRIAGVTSVGADGQPGVGFNILVRGGTSLTQSNAPLYVVDGFPIETSLNNVLNPNDIESLEVLKDASATAIYGARGANGVVIITTKKGKEGPPVLRYDAYYGVQEITKKMDVMSPYDFVRYQLALSPTTAASTYLTNGKGLDDYKSEKPVDWQDMLFRAAGMQNHTLSMSGGNVGTKYIVSGSYLNQDGTIINSGFQRYQGRMNLDQTINTKAKVSIGVNYTNNKAYGTITNTNPNQGSYSSGLFLLYSILGGRPTTNGVDLTDSLADPSITNINDLRVNPFLEATNALREAINNNILVNSALDYTVAKNFKLRVAGGINYNILQTNIFNNSKTQSGNINLKITGVNGVNGSVTYAKTYNWTNENTLTYTKDFDKRNRLTALVGFTQQGNSTSFDGHSAILIPNESLGLSGLDEGTPKQVQASSSNWFLMSYLARVNYDRNGKYLFTASYRTDGSSKFAPGNKWARFPSAAFAWRFSNENFMRKINFVSDAKLRLGYGTVGNNRVGDFAYLSPLTFSVVNAGAYPFNNSPTTGNFQSAVANEKLKWETTTSGNIGLDLTVFNKKIEVITDVYSKTTKDLLLNAQVPYATGFDNIFKNIGSVRNTGFEFTINTANVSTKTFTWTSSFNISFNRSMVLSLNANQESILSTVNWNSSVYTSGLYMAKINQPVAQFYGYKWDGLYQYADFDFNPATNAYLLKDNVSTNGNSRTSIQPGDPKFKDINGDLVVDSKDYTVIGRAEPIHTGGFSNNFTYKNFDLNVFFQWSYGNDIYNANRLVFETSGYVSLNQFASYANYWTPDNPSNQYVKPGRELARYSNRVLEDGSYLRLKTVSLGYNLPASLLKNYKIRNLRLYASAQNLYTWTNYSGYDPEVSTRNSALTPGFDYSAYPRARTITVGATISL